MTMEWVDLPKDTTLQEFNKRMKVAVSQFTLTYPCYLKGEEVDLYKLYILVEELKRQTSGNIDYTANIEEWRRIGSSLNFKGDFNTLILEKMYNRYITEGYNKCSSDLSGVRSSSPLRRGGYTRGYTRRRGTPVRSNTPRRQYNTRDASRNKLMNQQRLQLERMRIERERRELPVPVGEPDRYSLQPIILSLESELPNEVSFALNSLLLLSKTWALPLPKYPKLLGVLLAHTGAAPTDSGYYKYWDDARMREFWASLQQEEHFFNEDYDTEKTKAVQISVIFSNMCNVPTNALFLSKRLSFINYLLQAVKGSCTSIKNNALVAWTFMACEISLTDETLCDATPEILRLATSSLTSSDRFRLLSGLEIVAKLCSKEHNHHTLEGSLKRENYEVIFRTLLVPDVQVLHAVLEAMYSLTNLGPIPCQHFLNIPHCISTLVTLFSCKAESLEHSGVKVVKYCMKDEQAVTEQRVATPHNTTPNTAPAAGAGVNIYKQVADARIEVIPPRSSSPTFNPNAKMTNGAQFASLWAREKLKCTHSSILLKSAVYNEYCKAAGRKVGTELLSHKLFCKLLLAIFPRIIKAKMYIGQAPQFVYQHLDWIKIPILATVNDNVNVIRVGHQNNNILTSQNNLVPVRKLVHPIHPNRPLARQPVNIQPKPATVTSEDPKIVPQHKSRPAITNKSNIRTYTKRKPPEDMEMYRKATKLYLNGDKTPPQTPEKEDPLVTPTKTPNKEEQDRSCSPVFEYAPSNPIKFIIPAKTKVKEDDEKPPDAYNGACKALKFPDESSPIYSDDSTAIYTSTTSYTNTTSYANTSYNSTTSYAVVDHTPPSHEYSTVTYTSSNVSSTALAQSTNPEPPFDQSPVKIRNSNTPTKIHRSRDYCEQIAFPPSQYSMSPSHNYTTQSDTLVIQPNQKIIQLPQNFVSTKQNIIQLSQNMVSSHQNVQIAQNVVQIAPNVVQVAQNVIQAPQSQNMLQFIIPQQTVGTILIPQTILTAPISNPPQQNGLILSPPTQQSYLICNNQPPQQQFILPAGSSQQLLVSAVSSHQQAILPSPSSQQQAILPSPSSQQQVILPAESSQQQIMLPAESGQQQIMLPASRQQFIVPSAQSYILQPVSVSQQGGFISTGGILLASQATTVTSNTATTLSTNVYTAPVVCSKELGQSLKCTLTPANSIIPLSSPSKAPPHSSPTKQYVIQADDKSFTSPIKILSEVQGNQILLNASSAHNNQILLNTTDPQGPVLLNTTGCTPVSVVISGSQPVLLNTTNGSQGPMLLNSSGAQGPIFINTSMGALTFLTTPEKQNYTLVAQPDQQPVYLTTSHGAVMNTSHGVLNTSHGAVMNTSHGVLNTSHGTVINTSHGAMIIPQQKQQMVLTYAKKKTLAKIAPMPNNHGSGSDGVKMTPINITQHQASGIKQGTDRKRKMKPSQRKSSHPCHWFECTFEFGTEIDLSQHLLTCHVPKHPHACLWVTCMEQDNTRSRNSLIFHLKNIHARAPKLQSLPECTYTRDKVDRVLRAAEPWLDEVETPITRSLRLLIILVLRNFLTHAPECCINLEQFEQTLAYLAISTLEPSSICCEVLNLSYSKFDSLKQIKGYLLPNR